MLFPPRRIVAEDDTRAVGGDLFDQPIIINRRHLTAVLIKAVSCRYELNARVQVLLHLIPVHSSNCDIREKALADRRSGGLQV